MRLKALICILYWNTPKSGAIEYLINGMEDSIDKALFHIPKSQNLKRELKDSKKIVFWDDENPSSSSIELVEKTKGLEELFLFFSFSILVIKLNQSAWT